VPNARDGLIHGGRPSQLELHSAKKLSPQFALLQQLVRPRRSSPAQLDSAPSSTVLLLPRPDVDLPKFNIRVFHGTILDLGSVPLPVLEERIDRFIAEVGKVSHPEME
jgi:hypothetical protein